VPAEEKLIDSLANNIIESSLELIVTLPEVNIK
jgi:hypothetical protein